ncbi:MFS transporter [Actinomyces wuliandei]|uniref:MFS transporter n=1 Tax=Actinomyces wuliandei TaxID=2057743 RepID=UPI000FDA8B80|nr:MFS transporter [Actinomyces wuliandei]
MTAEQVTTETRYHFPPAGQAVLLLAAAMTTIDSFIVNVSLPSIQSSLDADASRSQFVISGYTLVYALLLVFGGRSGDRRGRRRMLEIGTVGFTAASLVCGLAPSIEVLIAARVVQGAFAALILPQIMSTIQTALVEPAKTRVLSYYAAIGGLAAAIGQLLGGVLVWANIGGLSWRLIFLINLPLGALVFFGARAWAPETRSDKPDDNDLGGTILFGAAVLALLIPLSLGSQVSWAPWTWVLGAVSLVLLAALWRYETRIESRDRAALIPPSLLRVTTMRRGLLVLGSGFMMFGGYLFVFALSMQNGNSMTPLESGMSMAPMALGQFWGAMQAPKLIGRIGIRTLQVGGLAQGLGAAAVILPAYLYWPHMHFYHLLLGMFLIGLGNGLFVPIIYRTVLAAIPPQRVGLGSGLITTVQQTTVAMGVAALGAVFSVAATMQAGFIWVLGIFITVAILYIMFGARIDANPGDKQAR